MQGLAANGASFLAVSVYWLIFRQIAKCQYGKKLPSVKNANHKPPEPPPSEWMRIAYSPKRLLLLRLLDVVRFKKIGRIPKTALLVQRWILRFQNNWTSCVVHA